jgi:hypothetical protein
MQLLWEHREGQQTGSTMYHFHDGTAGYYMAFNPAGEMVFHRILNQVEVSHSEAVKQEMGATKLINLSLNTAFKAVPTVFKSAPVPELSEKIVCVDFGKDLSLCFNVGDAVPFALPFYLMSQHRSSQFDQYVLVFVHSAKALIAAYAGEQLLVLNSYPVANEAEVLYFASAALKKAGISIQNARVELMAAEHASHGIQDLFKRFLNNTAYCPANLPYSLDQLPPQAHIAALMHLMPQCALPEEI